MNKNLKIGLSLLIAASVLFFCSAVTFFILKEAEREKRLKLQEELDDVLRAKEAIALDLEEIKIINQDLGGKLSSAKTKAQKISEELAKEKEAKMMLMSQLNEEKKKSGTLMADIMKEKEERLNLVQQLSKAEEAYHTLREQFELMVESKQTLEEKLKKMMTDKGVELERIEVKSRYQKEDLAREDIKPSREPAEPVISRSAKDASVLVINRKFDFIVTNIGSSDGVEVGTELDVYRDGKFIAKTKIEKLYDKMSAATILPEWKNAAVREGDQVYISP